MPHIIAYITTFAVFLGLDSVWLGFVARDFYASQVGALARAEPDLAVAAGFYALYAVGIVVFAVTPARRRGGVPAALWRGALLGLIAYGTYDLTNLATLQNWPVALSFVDLAWGTTLTGVSAVAGFWATRGRASE